MCVEGRRSRKGVEACRANGATIVRTAAAYFIGGIGSFMPLVVST